MKRRESYKPTASNDLASLSSNQNSLLLDNSNATNSLNTSTSPTTNSTLKDSSLLPNLNTSFLTSSISSISSTSNTNSSNKLKLKEICIQMPVAKPTINELKPQLSIENKQTKSAKTLIER